MSIKDLWEKSKNFAKEAQDFIGNAKDAAVETAQHTAANVETVVEAVKDPNQDKFDVAIAVSNTVKDASADLIKTTVTSVAGKDAGTEAGNFAKDTLDKVEKVSATIGDGKEGTTTAATTDLSHSLAVGGARTAGAIAGGQSTANEAGRMANDAIEQGNKIAATIGDGKEGTTTAALTDAAHTGAVDSARVAGSLAGGQSSANEAGRMANDAIDQGNKIAATIGDGKEGTTTAAVTDAAHAGAVDAARMAGSLQSGEAAANEAGRMANDAIDQGLKVGATIDDGKEGTTTAALTDAAHTGAVDAARMAGSLAGGAAAANEGGRMANDAIDQGLKVGATIGDGKEGTTTAAVTDAAHTGAVDAARMAGALQSGDAAANEAGRMANDAIDQGLKVGATIGDGKEGTTTAAVTDAAHTGAVDAARMAGSLQSGEAAANEAGRMANDAMDQGNKIAATIGDGKEGTTTAAVTDAAHTGAVDAARMAGSLQSGEAGANEAGRMANDAIDQGNKIAGTLDDGKEGTTAPVIAEAGHDLGIDAGRTLGSIKGGETGAEKAQGQVESAIDKGGKAVDGFINGDDKHAAGNAQGPTEPAATSGKDQDQSAHISAHQPGQHEHEAPGETPQADGRTDAKNYIDTVGAETGSRWAELTESLKEIVKDVAEGHWDELAKDAVSIVEDGVKAVGSTVVAPFEFIKREAEVALEPDKFDKGPTQETSPAATASAEEASPNQTLNLTQADGASPVESSSTFDRSFAAQAGGDDRNEQALSTASTGGDDSWNVQDQDSSGDAARGENGVSDGEEQDAAGLAEGSSDNDDADASDRGENPPTEGDDPSSEGATGGDPSEGEASEGAKSDATGDGTDGEGESDTDTARGESSSDDPAEVGDASVEQSSSSQSDASGADNWSGADVNAGDSNGDGETLPNESVDDPGQPQGESPTGEEPDPTLLQRDLPAEVPPSAGPEPDSEAPVDWSGRQDSSAPSEDWSRTEETQASEPAAVDYLAPQTDAPAFEHVDSVGGDSGGGGEVDHGADAASVSSGGDAPNDS